MMGMMAENPKPRSEAKAISKARYAERAKRVYGLEFWQFWSIFIGYAPRICPRCHSHSIRILHIGLPRNRVGGKIWCKWYLWCDSCLNGIYCPPGSYWISPNEPYILWGDNKTLKDALPKDLHLIKPQQAGNRSR